MDFDSIAAMIAPSAPGSSIAGDSIHGTGLIRPSRK
jgi:hypothetical protein